MNSALVDNWLLELVATALDPNSFLWTPEVPKPPMQERLTALFCLLDVVILHDQIFYDPHWAFTWQGIRAFDPIRWLLQEHDLPATPKVLLSPETLKADQTYSAVVRDGAEYYLDLASSLGVYYWPSPLRSNWLARRAQPKGSAGFVTKLSDALDSALDAMLREVLAETGMQSSLAFRGFGASVLAESNSLGSILNTALEIRSSRPCVAFREWLLVMDENLQAGDVRGLSKGLREVRGVIEDVRRELGLGTTKTDPELTLGLSPTIAISSRSVVNALGRLRPKPYHVVFLRQHLDRLTAQKGLVQKLDLLIQSMASGR